MTKLTFSDKACYRKRNACFLAGNASLPVAGCHAPARDGYSLPARGRNSGLLPITMQFLLIALIMLNARSWLSANTLKVALDGSQPYSVIQEAINASVNGDTVLVYPGRYIENVDYNGKNITLASLELITGNSAYRDSTIIDGNYSGSAVKSILAIDSAGLLGFTITNGTGSIFYYSHGYPIQSGGGVWLKNAVAFIIKDCLIFGNTSFSGGGIGLRSSTAYMSGTIIRENHATSGGGIYLAGDGQVVFDQIDRCSVYNNTAGNTQDILGADTRLETNIYLDIGTVLPISEYYVYYSKSAPTWPGGFPVIDIQRGYRIEINHDFYVSPTGDDNNNGLSSSSPLKSIYKAMQMVASDSLNPKSVHLARGVYSTNDGQFFPINTKPFVNLVGDSLSYPVLENLIYRCTLNVGLGKSRRIENLEFEFGNNSSGPVAISGGRINDILIRNIKINPFTEPSTGSLSFGTNNYYPASYILENVAVKGQNSDYQCGYYNNMPDVIIRNLTIEGCHNTGDELDGAWATFYFYGNKLTLENSKIINNTMDYDDMSVVSIGMRNADSNSRLIMNNVLIANNQSGGYTPVFIAAYTDSTSIISNCTFANNSGSNIASILNGNLRIANCIFDSDAPVEILCQGTYPNTVSHVSFENNFIRGYPNSFSSSAVNQISFNDVVLTGDPGFCSGIADDPMSYRLGNSSQCREAGTPDTTGLYLPEYDLYGNQRVFGSAIDIGCNEWNYPVLIQDSNIPAVIPLSVYPNPFHRETRIGYSLAKPSLVEISIYNLKGQLVRNLYKGNLCKAEQAISWEGCDDEGRRVSSGLYLLQLKLDGKPQRATKLLKL